VQDAADRHQLAVRRLRDSGPRQTRRHARKVPHLRRETKHTRPAAR
jgi:hypothetical protein